jgi:glycine dehydrogenase subunit 2
MVGEKMYRKLIFELSKKGRNGHVLPNLDVPEVNIHKLIPAQLLRSEGPNLPEVAENEAVRHYISLSTLNHHVDKAFYPLGSCTMKYNPKINEQLAGLPNFANLHPEQPQHSVQGALQIMYELQEYLKEITGFYGMSLQPAAGAQGEMVGLLLMKKYHTSKGRNRKIILVPDSAHGTNPASAIIAGFSLKTIRSNEKGTVDLADLREKISDDVAGIMLTNPSTLGIFEDQIEEIRSIMDSIDALMYMDGANMNALFGIVRPADMGFDVMHLNLHKSFSTPHGGGGPGSGPVGVNEKLMPFLPLPVIEKNDDIFTLKATSDQSIGKVHSFFGNFALLVRAYVYVRMVGKDGFRKIAEHAIVNANYIRKKLSKAYEIGYDAPTMHEFVLSAERQKQKGGKALDIAKRLLDFGIHPPTVYFPLIVKEAMMIEPGETESKEMLDLFINAMLTVDEELNQNPQLLLDSPTTTPVKRLDEAGAARNLDINYYQK